MSDTPGIKAFLTDYHARVMACETDAGAALAKGDTQTYRELLRKKAQLLADIAREARPSLKAVSDRHLARRVRDALDGFSYSADMGLSIGSPFYWSALLWDDNAKPGDPDNLLILIDSLPDGV